jgi:hypothetical protein
MQYTRKGRVRRIYALKRIYSYAKGARNTGAEIVCNIQRGSEYRATQ